MGEDKDVVEVTLKLPKPAYDFYKGLTAFLRENMESILADILVKDVDAWIDDFASHGELVVERYGLEQYSNIKTEGKAK